MQTYLEKEIDQLKRRLHTVKKNLSRGITASAHFEDVELEVQHKLEALEAALSYYKEQQ